MRLFLHLPRYDDYRDPVTGQKYIVDHAPHTEMAAYEKRIKQNLPQQRKLNSFNMN